VSPFLPPARKAHLLVLAEEYPSVYFIAFGGCLLQTLYSVYWSFAVCDIALMGRALER
jgi:hypothetical protein